MAFSWRLLMGILAGLSLVTAITYMVFAQQERGQERQECVASMATFTCRMLRWAFLDFWFLMLLAGGAEGALTFWGASYVQLTFDVPERIGGWVVAGLCCGMVVGRIFYMSLRQHLLLAAMLISTASGQSWWRSFHR